MTNRIDQPHSSPSDLIANGRSSEPHRPAGSNPAENNPAGSMQPSMVLGKSAPAHTRDQRQIRLTRATAEFAQYCLLAVDVARADLEVAEAEFGPSHPTTSHFRNSLNQVRRSWERLRAALGIRAIEAALSEPPLTTLVLKEHTKNSTQIVLVLIDGKTYSTQKVPGTELAPIQWRLARLHPPLDDGPYYVCRLANGSTQCDCADWTYRIAETTDALKRKCKHVSALSSLGWI